MKNKFVKSHRDILQQFLHDKHHKNNRQFFLLTENYVQECLNGVLISLQEDRDKINGLSRYYFKTPTEKNEILNLINLKMIVVDEIQKMLSSNAKEHIYPYFPVSDEEACE